MGGGGGHCKTDRVIPSLHISYNRFQHDCLSFVLDPNMDDSHQIIISITVTLMHKTHIQREG